MKKGEGAKLPEFQSLEEERQHWEARGPLAEERKGRANKPQPGQRRSSFLAVRLTGEELTRLRDTAAKRGLGPSTFARLILTSAIEHEGKLPARVTLGELRNVLEASLPQPVKQRAEALARASAIGGSDNPAMFILDASNKEALEEFTWSLLSSVFALGGGQVITPENKDYQAVRDLVKAQR